MTQGLAHTVDGVGVGSGTPHELFMEAAAVETLAVALASDGGRHWSLLGTHQRWQWRVAARRLIAESMKADAPPVPHPSPDPSNSLPPNPESEGQSR